MAGHAGAMDRRNRWARGDRGAAAVEAALVTPLVLGLFFGIVELGLLFKDYLAVAGSVRAGVRIASASPRLSTFAQDAADKVAKTGGAMNFKDVKQLWVYKVDPTTDKPCVSSTVLPSTTPCVGASDFSNCRVCAKFTWNASTKKFDKSSDTWASTDQNACSSSGPGGPPDRIGVYLMLKHDGVTKFVFNTINISEASILTLEPIPIRLGCSS